jgi:hypothetical protein
VSAKGIPAMPTDETRNWNLADENLALVFARAETKPLGLCIERLPEMTIENKQPIQML